MQKKSLLFALFIAIISWFGLVIQYSHLIINASSLGLTKPEATARFFKYFTILSNIMVAVSTTAFFLFPKSGISNFLRKPFIISAITVYIFMVGVGYNLLLRGTWNPQGWHKVSDEIVHVADPLLFALYWYFFAPKNSLKWKYSLYWLLVPAVYFVYVIIRGTIDGFYPYPFLDPNKLGYTRMLLNAAGVGIAFIAAGLLFIKLGQWQKNKTDEVQTNLL